MELLLAAPWGSLQDRAQPFLHVLHAHAPQRLRVDGKSVSELPQVDLGIARQADQHHVARAPLTHPTVENQRTRAGVLSSTPGSTDALVTMQVEPAIRSINSH